MNISLQKNSQVFILLLAILVLGGVIRGISLIRNGPDVLLDLDSFHSLRAIESITSTGTLPKFDPLSSAPNGTSYTFATSHGYYGFIASLALLAGLSPSEALSISPIVFFILELLSIFATTLMISRSSVAALFAAFFTIGLHGWSAISILGGDPVAENLGAVLFLVAMMLALSLLDQASYLTVGLLVFVDATSLEAHPVSYYFVNLVLVAMVLTLLLQKDWKRSRLLLTGIVGSTYSLGLLQLSGSGLGEEAVFSKSAFWLATVSRIYTIDNSILLNEIGTVTLLLAGTSVIVILIHRQVRNYLLVAWAAVLYLVVLVGELTLYPSYGALVEAIPFSAPLTLSHRVMPYLPPVICVLAGIAFAKFILAPATSLFLRLKQGEVTVGGAIILIVLALSWFQLAQAFQYSTNYASSFNIEPTHTSLFAWIKSNTTSASIFIANDASVGEYIKAIDNRAVFFTTSQEDLSVTDLTQRATLQTCLYLPECETNSTEQMIRSYGIDYAIIITPALIIDQNASSFVNFNYYPIAGQYLSWFQSRPGFVEVYSDQNSAVFSV